MKTKATKILSFVLALVMMITVVPPQQVAEAKDENILFTDDFSETTLMGWESQSVGNVSEGAYSLGQSGYNTISKLGNQKDCIISADVSVNIGKDDTGARQGGTASLVVRGDKTGTVGYEFGLGVSKSGNGYVRLYRRAGGNNSVILLQKTNDIPGVGTIQRNQRYNLTLAVIGSRIMCFVDGTLFADVQDTTYGSGFVGVKTTGAKGVFDNVKVEKTVEQKVESISVVSHSDSVSLTGKIYATINVVYNSIYGTEVLNQDSEGIKITGLDGKTGNKTMVVSYGGKNTTFPLKVTGKYTPVVLHEETFSNALSGYEDGTYTNKEYNFTYGFASQSGKGVVTAANTKGGDVPVSVDLTVPASKSVTWKQYSVSADVAVTGDSKTATERAGQAAIIVAKRTADRTNYTYRVSSVGAISIYCGSDLLYNNTTSALGLDFAKGKKVTLRADVYEDHAEFYYNGKLITIITDIQAEKITPHAGLSSINGSTWFDNWTVKELETKGAHAVKSFDIVSTATQDKITSIKASELKLADLMLKVSYIDNTTGLVAVKDTMVSSYQKGSSKPQTITITYAGQRKNLTYTYVPYLFYDEFASGYSSQWQISVNPLSSYEVKSGKFSVKYTDGETKASGVTATVNGGENWTNYAVSADVFLDARAKINRGRTVGLIARKSGSYYYEFRLEYSGTRLTGRLYRFGAEGATVLKTFGTSQLRECVGEKKALGLGVEYNMRLEVRSNTIKCYLDGVALPVFVDDTEYALTSGTAGIKTSCCTATYDNFTVQAKSGQSISALRLSGTKDNTIELYEGFDVDIPSYTLEVVDSDGSFDSVPLTVDVVSEFDNTALGKQKITLTYQGFSYPATVVISERPEELKAFAKAVEAVDVNVAGEKEVMGIKEQYDKFSAYELSQVDASVLEKYELLLETYERATDKNLEGVDLLWADALNEVKEEDWSDSIEGNSGKWFLLNNTFYQAQRPYNLVVNGWRSPNVYGEVYSISADMEMLSQDMYMGMALNMGETGYYHARVSNKDRNEDNEVVYKVQLLKKTNNGHKVLNSEYLAAYDIKLDLNVEFNMRLALKDGILSVYINGTQVLVYDDSTNNNQYTYGECGLRISEGDGLYDNIRVYGKALERPQEDTDPIEPTTYKDDFDDEVLNSDPSHWQENYSATEEIDNWKVYEKNGSRVYGTNVTTGLTETWLHVFEKEPSFTTKFMVEKVGKGGQIGFITAVLRILRL